MRSVGLKVLKNKLSEYVRLAEGGETVLVTDRNRVVAELVPPQPSRATAPDEWWAEAVRKGWITPAKNTDRSVPPVGPPVMTLEELLDELARDREDR
jgi:prevent-host-death family protein